MIRAALLCTVFATPLAAQDLFLQWPETAQQTVAETEALDRYLIPTGPWSAGGLPSFEAQGAIQKEIWQIEDFSAGTGVMLAVLSGQLEEAGFDPLFSCTTRVCGGFDFRFALDVVPEPDMHVNLSDFAFYAGRRDTDNGPEYSAILISQGGGTGFVQTVFVMPEAASLAEVTLSSRTPSAVTPEFTGLAETLGHVGRAPLSGISFAYGSTALADPEVPVLAELAAYLDENPEVRLTLVGHTDAEGGLQSNITVSRARAESVRRLLIDEFGIAAGRLDAEGVGFLLPLAPNTTQEGRDLNRRVEAVVINTQ